jgi:hypothetical protein
MGKIKRNPAWWEFASAFIKSPPSEFSPPKLPPFKTLLSIAAQIHRREDSADEAVRAAYRLYRAAQELPRELPREMWMDEVAARQGEADCPRSFPALLDEFLLRALPDESKKERVSRFTKWLRHAIRLKFPRLSEKEMNSVADAGLTHYSQIGFADSDEWVCARESFDQWWPKQKSASASVGGKARAKKAKQDALKKQKETGAGKKSVDREKLLEKAKLFNHPPVPQVQ